MQQSNPSIARRHYLLIALTGLAGFILVLSMRFSLKNDILAFDYPIKFQINNSIQQGASPLWSNYWAQGFPFDTLLTWSAYSPAQMATLLLGPYSLYTLHLEFLFYVLLCGLGFYRLLSSRFRVEPAPALLLSLSYMLSGFTVGSSQWLGYISCAAFFPLLLAQFIRLMRNPNLRSAILSGVLAYLMFTSTYVPLSIVCCYILMGGFLYFLVRRIRQGLKLFPFLSYAALAAGILLLLIWPVLHQTIELLPALDRGKPIDANKTFFNSNYLHPSALLSLLFPLQSVRLHPPNTEGTMMHLYLGLWPVLLLPPLLIQLIRNSKTSRAALFLFLISLFWLLAAMGDALPIRSALNLLPGFSYFRHPGILRYFFILFFLLGLGIAFPTRQALQAFLISRCFKITVGCLALAYVLTLAFLLTRGPGLNMHGGFKAMLNELSPAQGMLISAGVQLLILIAIFISRKSLNLLLLIAMADMAINTLICTPFFTVSSYSVANVMQKIPREARFPLQTEAINAVPTQVREGNAVWYNTHCFAKKIATKRSYYGPLDLRTALDDSLRPVLPAHTEGASLRMTQMGPGLWEGNVHAPQPAQLTIEQNYLPGWEASWQGKPLAIQKATDQMQLTVTGSGNFRLAYRPHGMRSVWIEQCLFWLLLAAGLLIKPRRRAYVL